MESFKRRSLQNSVRSEINCNSEGKILEILDVLQNQPNHSSLKILKIDCKISVDCAISIANVLKINKSINTLDFSSGIICRDGVLAIFEALSKPNNNTLKKLDLSGNGFFDCCEAIKRKLNAHKLNANTSLTEPDAWDFSLDYDAAIIFGELLKVNTSLTMLNLQGNEIGNLGTVAMADGIKANDSSSLHFLNISNNNIGVVGARSIATMLMTNKYLVELDLCRNTSMGADGVNTIVDALKQNQSLTTLKLNFIRFGDDSARNIATMLKMNTSLEELGMERCEICDDGATAIADALAINKSLQCLDLQGNPISRNVITTKLVQMLEINTTLRLFRLGKHIEPIDDVVAGVVLNALEDYNDTVFVLYMKHCDFLEKELQKKLDTIREIGDENLKGIRVAPMKAARNRRSIFKGLQFMWIQDVVIHLTASAPCSS